MEERIRPEIGIEYLINSGREESFKGIYIGKNPVDTISQWIISPKPEGHVFVREGESELEIYFARVPEETIPVMWRGDGFDHPSWPVGFSVERSNVRLSYLETRYLNKLIKKSEQRNPEEHGWTFLAKVNIQSDEKTFNDKEILNDYQKRGSHKEVLVADAYDGNGKVVEHLRAVYFR